MAGVRTVACACFGVWPTLRGMSALSERIEMIQTRIAQAAQRAGRDVSDVALVAVTKKVSPEVVDEAVAAGLTLFGESKVQEAKAKIPLVSGRARWQMIGHLQSNKARDAVMLFESIHSVDTVHLASELNKWADRAGKTQEILLEINVAGEKSKFGMKLDEAEAALDQIRGMHRLHVRGLMTIAPFVEELEKVRPYFRQLRALRDRLGLTELSMGMTHDFEVAIEEGATMVRVGTAIFGERLT
jgi:pyridoxal phosphate enzyme (YggS family)